MKLYNLAERIPCSRNRWTRSKRQGCFKISSSVLHLELRDRRDYSRMSLTDCSPLEVAKAASLASRNLAILPTKARNDALTAIHDALQASKETILAANAKDLTQATKAAEDGELSQSVLKRLDLGRKGKWEDMLKGILDVRQLDDPSRKTTSLCYGTKQGNG